VYAEKREPARGEPAFTASRHGEVLHGVGAPRHHVVLAWRSHGWRQQAYPVSKLADILPELTGETDVYFTQGRFYGYRRLVANLAGISAAWSEMDFYKVPELQGMHPLAVLEEAQVLLERAKIPTPSLAISTGRGLAALWLHDPVPREALPRWNAVQKRLHEVLKPLGADAGAKDAARVLRLAGTVNGKSGKVVEALRPPGEVWAFGDLADEVLPYTREEMAELRDLRIPRAVRRPTGRLWTPGQGLTVVTLWEARLSDLQLLLRLRWDGELPPGRRDRWLFLAGCAMSWLAVTPEVMRRELYALAQEAGGWSEGETVSRLSAVINRAMMAEGDEKIRYGSVEVDPRYRFTTQTIQDWLEVTADEERHMRTLISPAEKARRRAQKRRQAGVPSREDTASKAEHRRREARRRASEREPHMEIAKALGVSVHTVRSYVNGRR
jgi:hypothetical protein